MKKAITKRNYFSIVPDIFLPQGKMANPLVVYLSLSMLFAISFTYLFWFGNGRFFYQENYSLFVFAGDYLQKFTCQPGGLLVYASNFLTQGYFNPFYGSVLISILLALFCTVFFKIYRFLPADSPFSLLFILLPSCGLLFFHTRYDFFLQYYLGYLLVALWFLASIVPSDKRFRFLMLVMFPIFYYVAGSFALIYLGMYFLFGIVYENGILRIFPAFLLLIAIITFWIFKEILFLYPADQLLNYPLSIYRSPASNDFSYLLDGSMVLFPLFIYTSGQFDETRRFAAGIALSTLVILFSAEVILLSKFHDAGKENLIKIERLFYNQDWDAVIRQHESHPSDNVFSQYYYNLALSEKGQLCNRIFFGHQSYGPLSLTLPTDIEQADKTVYFYYAIGLVSEAHHLAYEMMVTQGFRPENIKMLIKTELINGNYKIARRYIQVLKKTWHYRHWVKKYERMNFNPALISSDPELGEKRRMIPKNDFYIGTNDVQNLDALLKENPDNKKAFEYKIARLLLEKDLVEVAKEVRNMKKIGYTRIPRHIEEAMVELMNVTREAPDLGGLSISEETGQRFIKYIADYKSCNGNKSLFGKQMTKADKNSFWYYLQFGIVRSNLFRTGPVDNSIY